MPTLVASRNLPPAVSVPPEERARLLAVARIAVAAAARGDPQPASEAGIEGASRDLRCGAAFVTLLNRGELRGCIGLLDPARPLAETVALAAFDAARSDRRFLPVGEAELPAIEIEISVLGRFVVLDDPLAFRLGIDGVFVQRGFARGLLLPQVATTHGLGARSMLEATCEKAGLRSDAWRDPATRVSAFRTERFGGAAIA